MQSAQTAAPRANDAAQRQTPIATKCTRARFVLTMHTTSDCPRKAALVLLNNMFRRAATGPRGLLRNGVTTAPVASPRRVRPQGVKPPK